MSSCACSFSTRSRSSPIAFYCKRYETRRPTLRVYVRQLRQNNRGRSGAATVRLNRNWHWLSAAGPGLVTLSSPLDLSGRRNARGEMKIKDLLAASDVAIDVQASDKRGLLNELGRRAALALDLPVD